MILDIVQFPSYAQAEKEYINYLYNKQAKPQTCPKVEMRSCEQAQPVKESKNAIVQEIEKARQQIKTTLSNEAAFGDMNKIEQLENNQKSLLKMIEEVSMRLNKIELSLNIKTDVKAVEVKTNDDDDIDLFGSDDEVDEEAEKLKEERIKQYQQKKVVKPGPIAKSSIVLDVKPWDDETDMKEMEKLVRSVESDGLLWGASKLVPLAFGIKKLQICCVVEDDKVGTDFLEESITAFEELVQSVDIAAFNKV